MGTSSRHLGLKGGNKVLLCDVHSLARAYHEVYVADATGVVRDSLRWWLMPSRSDPWCASGVSTDLVLVPIFCIDEGGP